MELRELRAFVAAGRELHFARAAASLHMHPSKMSELIRRLELELGAPLFHRTTRRVALTEAGRELLERAEVIIALSDQASEAIATIARGRSRAVRLGLTPPAAPIIAPHLTQTFTAAHPGLSVEIQRMWRPALAPALRAGAIDAALTCGDLGVDAPDIHTVEVGSEQLLVGLRADDPAASGPSIDLSDLRERTLGMHPPSLFPAWDAVGRQILRDAGVAAPIVELEDPDLSARAWTRQREIDWIMLIGSLCSEQAGAAVLPVRGHTVPFTLSWSVTAPQRSAVRDFLRSSLTAELPAGWHPPREPTLPLDLGP